jgi:hypothetical protein
MENVKKDQEKIKDLQKWHKALLDVRQPLESVIDILIDFCNHTRKKINDDPAATRGQITGQNVYDGTANSAAKIYADGLFGNLCSQSLRWFSLVLPGKIEFAGWSAMRKYNGKRMDEIPDVRAYLEGSDESLYSAFNRSNYYNVQPVFLRDGGTIGTAVKYLEEQIKEGRQVLTVLHPREYCIGLDNYGRADTLFRKWPCSLRQLVDKFGLEKLKDSDSTFNDKYEKNPYTEMNLVHAVLPRKDFDPSKKDNKNKPWASYFYLDGKDVLLSEGGYNHFPYIVWLHDKQDNSGYGVGPGHEAYVEIMLASQQGASNIIAGQKMVEGPLVAHENLRGLIQRQPKGITYLRNMDHRPLPLQENIQLPYALEMLDRTQKIIEKRWHVPFFMALSQAALDKIEMTAYQAMQIVGERATMLGPVVGRLSCDDLDPTIDLMFYGEQEAGRLPDIPQIMLDFGISAANIEVDYSGPLATAQRRTHQTQGIRQGLQILSEIAQAAQIVAAGSPQVKYAIRWPETVRAGTMSAGFPAKLLASDEEIQAAMQAEEEQANAQQMTQEIDSMAKILPAASKEIEPGSAIDALMGGALSGGQNG